MTERSYAAIKVRQTPDAADLVLFAAPAFDIQDWSGIPQRERLGDDETVGFQREENQKRLKELISFYSNHRNVIQNPLLCAIRSDSQVSFTPISGHQGEPQIGTVTIAWDDLHALPLVELLRRVKENLESRLPELAETEISDTKIARLRQRANEEHPELEVDDQGDDVNLEGDGLDDQSDLSGSGDDEGVASVLFSDETHIADFWEDVAARVQILDEVGSAFDPDVFLGFPKEAMVSYLQPVVVVDGQHRLKGAILAAEESVDSDALRSEIQEAIEAGGDPDEVTLEIMRRESRALPVSLLLDSSPAEHVFQFVVVNQKATPIGKALLGTIVSTSLSTDELTAVSERLTSAGIPLQDSQAIAYLTRHPDSPFKDLVEKGLAGEGTDLLQWNVLGSLVRVFRELKGGKLYHEKIDYADKWRRDHLDDSGIVSACPEGESKLEYWSDTEGPWRSTFIAFWNAVRDRLGTTEDTEAGNYWGSPRTSNLFNKISLTILAADFFQFLCERGYGIDSPESIAGYVDKWLNGCKTSYFFRDWKLGGVKKDATGTKAQWAYLWVQYRKDPVQLPQLGQFRQPRST